jgi:hypothetical protein
MFLSRAGKVIELAWSDAAREAAIAARRASEKAMNEPTEQNHQAAAEAHSAAATAHLKAGDKQGWEDHAGLAFEHMAKGVGGWRDAKTGKPNGNWGVTDHEKASANEAEKAKTARASGDKELAALHTEHSRLHMKTADNLRSDSDLKAKFDELTKHLTDAKGRLADKHKLIKKMTKRLKSDERLSRTGSLIFAKA